MHDICPEAVHPRGPVDGTEYQSYYDLLSIIVFIRVSVLLSSLVYIHTLYPKTVHPRYSAKEAHNFHPYY